MDGISNYVRAFQIDVMRRAGDGSIVSASRNCRDFVVHC